MARRTEADILGMLATARELLSKRDASRASEEALTKILMDILEEFVCDTKRTADCLEELLIYKQNEVHR